MKPKLRLAAYNRWIICHPDNPWLAWSGLRWVPVDDAGVQAGPVAVCNFGTEAEANLYIERTTFDES